MLSFILFSLCTFVVKYLAEMVCQRKVVKFWDFWVSDKFLLFWQNVALFLFQTLSYNRHNLTADTSERQAKEILIRRRHSLRESIRKDSSLSRERRVRTPAMEALLRVDSQEFWERGNLSLLEVL